MVYDKLMDAFGEKGTAALLGTIAAGGLGWSILSKINTATKGPVKIPEKELKAAGNIKKADGWYNAEGRKIADVEGRLLDERGNLIQKDGIVKRSWDKVWNETDKIGNKIKSRIFSTKNQSVKETTNGSHNTPANEYNNGINNAQYNQATDSIDNTHSTSPSSNSTSSINDKNENVKILKLFFMFWFISKNEKYTKNSYCSHC